MQDSGLSCYNKSIVDIDFNLFLYTLRNHFIAFLASQINVERYNAKKNAKVFLGLVRDSNPGTLAP